jgi:hypothetical protein
VLEVLLPALPRQGQGSLDIKPTGETWENARKWFKIKKITVYSLLTKSYALGRNRTCDLTDISRAL